MNFVSNTDAKIARPSISTGNNLARLDDRHGGGRLSVENVSHVFRSGDEEIQALSEIDFAVEPGEFVAIVGQSGCGKSTLLNILTGLLTPTEGRAVVDGANEDGFPTIGYITQHDSLLPWRTTLQNAAFALELRGFSKSERQDRARALLDRLGLLQFQDRYPHELSGGMRQRLSLARTLIYRPLVLLMDEPFAALDAQMRASLHRLLLDVWAETKTTIVFVTHDLSEAIALADRVITLSARPGRIKHIYKIDQDRPRDIARLQSNPSLHTIYEQLLSDLALAPPVVTPAA